jgi:O-antigen/teichoic acid export membrane protein
MDNVTSSVRSFWLRARSILRLRSGKLENAQDRSRERYRRAAWTGAAAALGKIVSFGTSILTVRLTFRYLGEERYGMWMTITSVVLMLGFADLGMSNGLVNIVANSLGQRDQLAAKKAIASVFWMLSAIAIVLTLAMGIAYPFLETSRMFNVHSPTAVRESGPALLVLFLCFVLNLPLGTVRGAQTGMQKGFVNSLWSALGTIASLIALLIAIHFRAGLPVLVLSLSGAPLVASLLNGVEFFGWSHPELLPNVGAFSRDSATRLFHTGMMFFLLQVSGSIGMQTDNVVIAQILGAKAVAAYAVPARLFNMVNLFLGIVSGTMWPAYADALACSDGPWIRRTFIRVTLWGTVIAVVGTTILIIFGNRILAIWVGPQMLASPTLLTVFGLQCALYAYLQPIAFLLNGLGQLRAQVTCAMLMAVLNLGLSIYFVKHYGIIGAVLGTVIALTVVVVVPLTLVTRRTLRELAHHPQKPDSLNISVKV